MNSLGYNNYIQSISGIDTPIISSNQSLQNYYLDLVTKIIEALESNNSEGTDVILSKIGDINTANTLLGILQLILNNPDSPTKAKQDELINAISSISFESSVSFDSTGLATSDKQDNLIGLIGDINTSDTLMFLLGQIVNSQNRLIEYINNTNPTIKRITHTLLKDINNDGFDDTNEAQPASMTIVGGKRYVSWFIRGGHPVIDGVIWHPQEEKSIMAGYGEVLDSVLINYTGSEVLVSYY